ncbi:MAG TPA: hypothetical protein VMW48_05315 [Vicinamibacterales bacterium]|nr:hypothetical protein [Vicinamibacterales bacterium]
MLHVKSWTAAGLIAAVAVVSAADYRTVQGELTAPSCTPAEVPEVAGESPAARTMRCARQGLPMAIQTADGLFLVEGDYAANNNAKLLDFVAKPVEAKGQVTEREGRMTITVAAMVVRK